MNSTANETEIVNTARCIDRVVVQARSLPNYSLDKMTCSSASPLTEEPDSSFECEEDLPFTDSYYYVLIVSEAKVSYDIKITTQGMVESHFLHAH